MKTIRCILLLTVLSAFWSIASSQSRVIQPNGIIDRQVRLAMEIEKYLLKDRIDAPPPGGIEFIGSSIFRLWKHLEEQMAPLPVFNRAFGGSRTGEVLHYMDTLVLRYRPSIIVYYCGSNDVNAGAPAAVIAEGFIRFAERVRNADSSTSIYYVSINRAPQKRNRWMVVDSANAIVSNYCARSNGRYFIDVNPLLFNESQNPRLELYLEDQLHFRDKAYEAFAGKIKPVLKDAWEYRKGR